MSFRSFFLGLILFSSVGFCFAEEKLLQRVFPEKDWQSLAPKDLGFDHKKFKIAIDTLGPQFSNKSILIVKGYVLHRGKESSKLQRIGTATSAFSSSVAGLLIDDKKLKVTQKLSEYLPWLNEHYPQVTVEDLLTMRSGYRAQGDLNVLSDAQSGIRTPWVPAEPKHEVAKFWSASDDAMNLLGFFLTAREGKNFADVFLTRIANPLGMESLKWESVWSSKSQYVQISSGAGNRAGPLINAQDFARLGYLYLNQGRWQDERLLSKEWVHAATQVQVPSHVVPYNTLFDFKGPGHYGFHWWINGKEKPLWSEAPAGTYAALGAHNTLCLVIPEWDMVLARVSEDSEEDKSGELNNFFKEIRRARLGNVESDVPLPTVSPEVKSPLIPLRKAVVKDDLAPLPGLTLPPLPASGVSTDAEELLTRLKNKMKSAETVASEKTQSICQVSGVFRPWELIQIDCRIPKLETQKNEPKPSSEAQMKVTFKDPDGKLQVLPGFLVKENTWRCYLRPHSPGKWTYTVSFRPTPKKVTEEKSTLRATFFLGENGTFQIDKRLEKLSKKDFKEFGYLKYVGSCYYRFSNGTYFLKVGLRTLEDFLSHHFTPHVKDWNEGDPLWQQSKGKGIIGAINYLSQQEINALSILIELKAETFRDQEKLDQWEMIFSHMETQGIALNIVLDPGVWSFEEKRYLREFIARFGHHLALMWDLGEELSQSSKMIKENAAYLKSVDPYEHPITLSQDMRKEEQPSDLDGVENIQGTSLKVPYLEGFEHEIKNHHNIARWILNSKTATQPRVLSRKIEDGDKLATLWSTLLAGGSGIEWVLKKKDSSPIEDLRSYEKLWSLSRIAYNFFAKNKIPLAECQATELPGSTLHSTQFPLKAQIPSPFYLVTQREEFFKWRPAFSELRMKLPSDKHYRIQWLNPRTGALLCGTIETINTSGDATHFDLGQPPRELGEGWMALIFREYPR